MNLWYKVERKVKISNQIYKELALKRDASQEL